MARTQTASYPADAELANKIKASLSGKYERDKRAYHHVKKIVYRIDPSKWHITEGTNWKGRKVKDVLIAELGPITISLEDRLNQGYSFYLQVYDCQQEGFGRIGCWNRTHEEDSLYHDIFKARKKSN